MCSESIENNMLGGVCLFPNTVYKGNICMERKELDGFELKFKLNVP